MARLRDAGGQPGIALNMVQKWLGHAQLTTAAIYADAVCEEEHRRAGVVTAYAAMAAAMTGKGRRPVPI